MAGGWAGNGAMPQPYASMMPQAAPPMPQMPNAQMAGPNAQMAMLQQSMPPWMLAQYLGQMGMQPQLAMPGLAGTSAGPVIEDLTDPEPFCTFCEKRHDVASCTLFKQAKQAQLQTAAAKAAQKKQAAEARLLAAAAAKAAGGGGAQGAAPAPAAAAQI